MSSIASPRGAGRWLSNVGLVPNPRPSITGTSGVWTNVTPAAISLVNADHGGDNIGLQDVLAHPTTLGKFYAFTTYNGFWMSTDFGLTWARQDAPGGVMDGGKSWGSAIAPDGSYLLACSGNNFTQYNGIDGRRQIFKSIDDGVTWTPNGDTGADPYDIDVDASNALHAVCCFHDTGNMSESWDGGATWTSKGATGGGLSSYVRFISTTVVITASQQGASEGCWRGVSSGSAPSNTWVFTRITDLNGNEHDHGAWEPFIDTVNGLVFAPGDSGIYKSSNAGVNFTQVSAQFSTAIAITATTLYAAASFPTNTVSPASPYDPKFLHATRPGAATWTPDSTPGGMTNGPKRMASGTDGSRWCILSGNWLAGLWRYVE